MTPNLGAYSEAHINHRYLKLMCRIRLVPRGQRGVRVPDSGAKCPRLKDYLPNIEKLSQ
jgi:hypothetical protein